MAEEKFALEGAIKLSGDRGPGSELQLMAALFNRSGELVAATRIANAHLKMAFSLKEPQDLLLVIGPEGDPKTLRKSASYKQRISKEQLLEGRRPLKLEVIYIPFEIWNPWHPYQICISGHVRKLTEDGKCPVPYAKVEIFDVDREGCWWPYILKYKELLFDRQLVNVEDLIKEPLPKAIEILPSEPRLPRELNLDPDILDLELKEDQGKAIGPDSKFLAGEVRTLSLKEQARLHRLTILSSQAPWLLYPLCFYSRAEICETTTDEDGYFNCCFTWFPFHFRRGRLRYDARPDIIIRVTQVIDGVERVIYMDPYTSTRWSTTSTHIDLCLDNPDVQCGSGDSQDRPQGTQTFFTRIGNDKVYQINQSSGLFNGSGLTNVAYGHSLAVHAQFGDNLSDGSPKRYYRLSYAKSGQPFVSVTASLYDTRVNKATNFSESHFLGPQTVGTTAGLYEIRNFDDYLWYNPDRIGTFFSHVFEPDSAKYTLRLEIFDENGNHMNATQVDYLDGTVPPPTVLPSTGTNHCDLVLTIDNKAPSLSLGVPNALNTCGVVNGHGLSSINIEATASQENGRLRSWALQYQKGTVAGWNAIDSQVSSAGNAPAPVNPKVWGNPTPIADLTTTCAFALRLSAWPHIRNGYSFIYYREQTISIAIEKCS